MIKKEINNAKNPTACLRGPHAEARAYYTRGAKRQSVRSAEGAGAFVLITTPPQGSACCHVA